MRADIEAGALHPYISIHDYSRYADREVRKWLGLKSWIVSKSFDLGTKRPQLGEWILIAANSPDAKIACVILARSGYRRA